MRRRLNQAIFDGIFVTDETIAAAAMNEPHGHLFAAQSAHLAARAGHPGNAISAAFDTAYAKSTRPTKKTAPKGGLLNSTSATTAWSSVFSPSSADGGLTKTPMVEMGGIEPPSIAGTLRLLRAQSVETFCSAPTFVTDT